MQVIPEVVIHSTENRPNLVVADGRVVKAHCRCGCSGHKPFCDGTDAKNGFREHPNEVKVF